MHSHKLASSQTEFNGRECPEEALGCHVMRKNENSHDCNTPGAKIGQGYHQIKPKGPVPKRDGPLECCGGVKPHCKHRRVLRKVFPFPLKNSALGLEIHNKSKTIVVSTTRMLCSLVSDNW